MLSLLESRRASWRSLLSSKGVVVTTDPGGATAFHHDATLSLAAAHLEKTRASLDAVVALCDAMDSLIGPCLLDIRQACELHVRQGLPPAECLRRSRVRYQGTDGVRGKVS